MDEGVCSGVAEGVAADTSEEIEGEGDCSIVGDGVAVGDSCPNAKADKMAITNVRMVLVVMSSEVEASLTV